MRSIILALALLTSSSFATEYLVVNSYESLSNMRGVLQNSFEVVDVAFFS
jgi:hypothetical protein